MTEYNQTSGLDVKKQTRIYYSVTYIIQESDRKFSEEQKYSKGACKLDTSNSRLPWLQLKLSSCSSCSQ